MHLISKAHNVASRDYPNPPTEAWRRGSRQAIALKAFFSPDTGEGRARAACGWGIKKWMGGTGGAGIF